MLGIIICLSVFANCSVQRNLVQDCLADIMLGERRAAAMDEQKRSLATIKAVMRKLFVGE